MQKTQGALRLAGRENREIHPKTSPKFMPSERPTSPRVKWSPPDLLRYDYLKTNLLTRYPDGSVKTILFVGTAHGDGASTTAINYAKSLARGSQHKVLLIDANLRTPTLHTAFKVHFLRGLSDLGSSDNGCGAPIMVGPGNLYLIPCGRRQAQPVSLFESSGFEQFLKKMRDSYDYVILDAPPIHGFSDSRLLCTKVDGVVLVIESGKTRFPVALNAKKQLEEAGGKILGVVLNKRRFYIPEFIYKRL